VISGSNKSENLWNRLRSKLGNWTECRKECTQQRHSHDEEELYPGEIQSQLSAQQQTFLEHLGVANCKANRCPHQTAGKNKDHRLVEVEHSNSHFGKADSSEYSDFLGLLVQVGAHVWWECKETQEHCQHDNGVEHVVQDWKQFVGGFSVLPVHIKPPSRDHCLEIHTEFVHYWLRSALDELN